MAGSLVTAKIRQRGETAWAASKAYWKRGFPSKSASSFLPSDSREIAANRRETPPANKIRSVFTLF